MEIRKSISSDSIAWRILKALLIICSIMFLFNCSAKDDNKDKPTSHEEANAIPAYTGLIHLYGEQHGVKKYLDKELSLWQAYYKSGMRHLFVELPYYTAEFLNIWMTESDDSILNSIYDDVEGTNFHDPNQLEFFKKLKSSCPLTIFHGTDVGHQYDTTGVRFLDYLESRNLKDSAKYQIAKNVIRQGQRYYGNSNTQTLKFSPPLMRQGQQNYGNIYTSNNEADVYRENTMVKNFVRELALVNNSDIMGIYGAAHTNFNSLDITGNVPCMAAQLKNTYNYRIESEYLFIFAFQTDPLRVDTFSYENKTYKALYYGRGDLKGFKDFLYRDYWLIENGYEDFKTLPKTGDVLPYDNYPMLIEMHQVFKIEYTKIDGTKFVKYYISDGRVWEGKNSTEEIQLK